LLRPSQYSEAGYRLYTDTDFAKLQRILTLKFLGFSLSEIKETFKNENSKESFKISLGTQKEIIYDKINHMKLVAKAISEAENMASIDGDFNWDKVIHIMRVINSEKSILEQYKNSANLVKRINIHDKYSTNKIGWHKWIFNNLKLCSRMKILEIGCGNAMLWNRNIDDIPEDCEVILTDISQGMLNDAKNNLGEYAKKFKFKLVDANNISFNDESFDLIIANHMLFYCNDRQKVLSEIKRVLKPGGYFYCSTVGERHMEELDLLAKKFHESLVLSEYDISSEFGLENGEGQSSEWFQHIKRYDYEDSLIVTDSEPLIQYVYSTNDSVKEILNDNGQQFQDYIEKELQKTGSIFISKSSGLFESRKL